MQRGGAVAVLYQKAFDAQRCKAEDRCFDSPSVVLDLSVASRIEAVPSPRRSTNQGHDPSPDPMDTQQAVMPV